MVTLEKVVQTGEIMHMKSCTQSHFGDKLSCYNHPTATNVAHCCYYNMCNTDITLTFPPASMTLPFTSVGGKSLFSCCK